MVTHETGSSIGGTLFGKTRRAVLGLLFTRSDRRFYLREIVRLTGSGEGPVQRELAALVGAGLVTREREGRQVYHQANRACPVFDEVRSLIVKTSGVADVLRDSLSPLADETAFACVYGSFARGDERSGSDVDVLVVGDAGFADVVRALGPAQEKLGREVNPTVFTLAEWRQKLAAGHPFVRDVVRKSKVMLVGDERGLQALAT